MPNISLFDPFASLSPQTIHFNFFYIVNVLESLNNSGIAGTFFISDCNSRTQGMGWAILDLSKFTAYLIT
jgi:hypothetical protein